MKYFFIGICTFGKHQTVIFMKVFKFLLVSICILFATESVSHPIDSIAIKYRDWILGSDNIDYTKPLVKERYDAIIRQAEKAMSNYEKKVLLVTDKKFDFVNDKKSSSEFISLVPETLFPLVIAYKLTDGVDGTNPYYKDKNTLDKIIEIYEKLHRKGWVKGLPINIDIKRYETDAYIGLGGSIALSYLTYGISTFLMQDELKEKGLFERELDMLHWITRFVGPEFDNPVMWKESGFNTDAVRSLMNTKLCYILSLPSEHPDREKEMIYFKRFLDNALEIAPGFADTIKPDYVGYHHKNMYANAYAVNSFHAAAIYVYILDGTPYAADRESIENLSNALLTNRIYAQKYDIPRSVSGRFPTNLSTLVQNIPAYAYMAAIYDNPLKDELEAAFMRLWEPECEVFHKNFIQDVASRISYFASMGAIERTLELAGKSVEPENDPNGFWFFPYGGLTIYRQKNWMVSWRGTSKYIWDFEGPINKNNEYGRFNGAGVLQIYATGKPVSAVASGYGVKGWNWSSLPGTTTLDIPHEKLPSKKHRQYSSVNFLGGTRLDDSCGVSSFTYADNLSSVKANKSVFFFDDYIYVLGTELESTGEHYMLQTTVAQLSVKDDKSKPYLNGDKYVDPYGHAYYFVNSKGVIAERKLQTEPLESKRGVSKGYYETCKINHGINPCNESYAYVINVNGGIKGADELSDSYSQKFKLIRSDKIAHILLYKVKGKKGYAVREAGINLQDDAILKVSAPCILATQKSVNGYRIAVSNPDMNRFDEKIDYAQSSERKYHFADSRSAPVIIYVKGYWKLKEEQKDVHLISHDKNTTKICFDCVGARTISTELIECK